MDWIHIYPLNDLIEHHTEGTECSCNPEIDFDCKLVIHAAMDRREVFEQKDTPPKEQEK